MKIALKQVIPVLTEIKTICIFLLMLKLHLLFLIKELLKYFFYIFTCDEGDKYELPEEIEEYAKKEKEDPNVINIYSHWFILKKYRNRGRKMMTEFENNTIRVGYLLYNILQK